MIEFVHWYDESNNKITVSMDEIFSFPNVSVD